MSHMTRVQTQLKSLTAIYSTLQRLGFTTNQMDIDLTNKLSIKGYSGRVGNQKCNVRVKSRHHTGGLKTMHGDMGWELNSDGTITMHRESMDHQYASAKWQEKFMTLYATEKAKEDIEEEGWELEEEEELADGSIRLVALI